MSWIKITEEKLATYQAGKLVDAMKKGQRMIVRGVSSKGTETKDTYSLSGFMSAYKAINAKCGRK